MILERGNVRLVRLSEEHIELVRYWRNFPTIRDTMEYRDYISPEMQKEWFARVNNINNNYFLIGTLNDTFIGLIYGSDIDWENNVTNNGGIFIWDSNYLESPEILQAALLLTDIGFYMGMKRTLVRILKDNLRSIAFNKAMGYRLLPGQDDVYNQKYVLEEGDYFKATQKIRQHFGFNEQIKLTIENMEYASQVGLERRLEQTGAIGKNVVLELLKT